MKLKRLLSLFLVLVLSLFAAGCGADVDVNVNGDSTTTTTSTVTTTVVDTGDGTVTDAPTAGDVTADTTADGTTTTTGVSGTTATDPTTTKAPTTTTTTQKPTTTTVSAADKALVDRAFALATGETIEGVTLTGVVTSSQGYSEGYGNATFHIQVEGTGGTQTIYCYRVKPADASRTNVEVGETVTLSGTIQNYKGTIEFYPAEYRHVGGDRFYNKEGLLPSGETYYECDIDTYGITSRGAKRLVWTKSGIVYYTGDHYASFTQLYGER